LGGLAALPTILSGGYQIKSYPRSRNPEKVTKDQTVTSYDDLPVKVAPSQGLIRVRSTTLNENGETIQAFVNRIAPRRDR